MHPGSEKVLLALLIPVSLLLACRSAPPAPPPIPDFTSCPDLAGSFLFEDLAASCRFDGHKGEFPTYAIKAHGDVRGPRDRKAILPLPLDHWADPGSRLKIEQKGCSKLVLSAYDPGPASAPYLVYEIDLPDLARRGTLDVSKTRLSFESRREWEGWQLPIGISRTREGWSLSRDEQGRLAYAAFTHKAHAVFWVIPMWSGAEVRCVLQGGG
jgi:hypothetical protein